MADPWTYIRGFTIANARAVAEYVFGDFLIRVEKNIPEHTYDIFVKEGLDESVIPYYRSYWGAQYRVFEETTTVSETESKEVATSN